MSTVETRIPFHGFYYSVFDAELDRAEELNASDAAERDDSLSEEEYAEIFYRVTSYGKAFNKVAEEYVGYFNDWFKEHIGIDLELSFVEMTSPREYNFETDKIFCRASEAALRALFDKLDKGTLDSTIHKHLASRSGFISFYGDFVREWRDRPLEGWDCNELYMLLEAAVGDDDDGEYTSTIADRMFNANVFDNAIDGAVDWGKFEQRKAKAIEEKVND